MRRNRLLWWAIIVLLIVLLVSAIGCAGTSKADYPARPITFIVPYAPGGVTDLATRAYSEALKAILPQPFDVVNKEGGATIPAVMELLQAKPDGYTILFNSTSSVLSQPILNPDTPLKGPESVQPIITASIEPMIFAVGNQQPWKTMEEVLAFAKANPGKIRVTTATMGGGTHLHFAHLMKTAGVRMTHVPTGSGTAGVKEILGGNAEATVMNVGQVRAQHKAGTARILAFFLDARTAEFPNIPTLKELGYNVITEGSTYLIYTRPGVPKEIQTILYESFKKAQQSEAFQKFVKTNGIITDDRNGDTWAKELASKKQFYAGFLKEIGMVK